MAKILSKKIIGDFRDLMNEYFYGAYKLTNVKGKNDWGLICSQMDWIQMWVEEIENISFDNKSKYRNKINATQFILGIDTIVTATKKLLDYFKINYTELKNKNNIFKDKYYPEMNDFKYFRIIRTACAIHPNDIKTPNDKKYYASWVNSIGNEIFIIIYSEKSEEENETLKVDRYELLLFANKWYEKIKDINSYIRPIIDNYISKT